MAQKKKIEDGGSSPQHPVHSSSMSSSFHSPATSIEYSGTQSNENSGKLLVKEEGTSYIDGSHWRGIIEEVSLVTFAYIYSTL